MKNEFFLSLQEALERKEDPLEASQLAVGLAPALDQSQKGPLNLLQAFMS
jgi:hypothetical protein